MYRVFTAGWLGLVILALCIGAGEHSKDSELSRRVTFSAPAMPASRLIPALAERTGVKLTCAPGVVADVLLLHVSDAPLSEVMAKLAEAAGAEWVDTETGFRITRTLKRLRDDERADAESRGRAIAPVIRRLSSSLNAELTLAVLKRTLPARRALQLKLQAEGEALLGAFDPERPDHERIMSEWLVKQKRIHQQLEPMDALNPDVRLLGRTLGLVGAAQIGGQFPETRVVYSTDPTPMQRPLGRGMAEIIRQYVRECHLWDRIRGEMVPELPKPKSEGEDDETPTEERLGDLTFSSSRDAESDGGNSASGPPIRALLVISRRSWTRLVTRVLLLDGRNRAFVRVSFDNFYPNEARPPDAKPDEGTGPAITISPMTAAIRRAMKARSATVDKWVPLVPEVRDWLVHPERNEPLSLLPSDGLLSVANARKQNVAAWLPDTMLRSIGGSTNADLPRVDRFLKTLSRLRVKESDGWLIVSPVQPHEARLMRFDRRALGTTFRFLSGKETLNADERASAAHVVGGMHRVVYLIWLKMLLSPAVVGFEDPVVRAYGSLELAQREVLRAGRALSFVTLTAAQRNHFSAAVYGTDRESFWEGAIEAQNPPPALGELAEEPTVVAPRGLPPAGKLRARHSRRRTVILIDPFAGSDDEREVFQFEADAPKEGYYSGDPERKFEVLARARFQIQWHSWLEIELEIAPWYRIRTEVEGDLEPATDPPQPLDRIPADLRERLRQELDTVRLQDIPDDQSPQPES